MASTFEVLSSSPDGLGDALEGIATHASLSTIHTVPSGEVHVVTIVLSNLHATNSITVKGDIGATVDSFMTILLPLSSQTFKFTLSNTTLKLGAVADAADVNVTGIVELQS